MSELSIEARALIRRVGTADGPSHTDRARVRRRIVAGLAGAGATLGSGTIASGAPAGAAGIAAVTKVTVSSVALWLAAGAALGTAVSAPAVISAFRRAEQVRAPVSVAAVDHAPGASEVPRAAAPAAVVTEAPALPAKPVAPVSVDPPRASASLGATSLAEETRLLHAAQRELARKNTSAALALLDEHASKFPGGALAEERTAARVLALCDLGRTAEARLAADAFVEKSPQSPLVPRLRGSCAAESRVDDDRE